jgi:tetratricopeptide (TPR) repeat protein
MIFSLRGHREAALVSAQRALELAPQRADLQLWFGVLLVGLAREEEAIRVLKGVTRLDPKLRYMHLFQIALVYRRLGRIDEAIAKHRESLALNPGFFGAWMNLAAIHAQLGEMNQARAAFAEMLRLRPGFRIRDIPRLPSGRDFLVENLRKLGLPE